MVQKSSRSTAVDHRKQRAARTWAQVGTLVGHWDFSDSSTITDSGGYSIDNGEGIYKITNKSTSPGRLGNWLIQTVLANRPAFQTGGANSKSYADFDGTDFVKGTTSTSNGSIDAFNFADNSLSLGGCTIFIIHDPASADPAEDQCLFMLMSGTNSANTQEVRIDIADSDDQYRVKLRNETDLAVESKDTNVDVVTGAQLYTLQYSDTGSLTTAGIFYKDGVQGSAYTVDVEPGSGLIESGYEHDYSDRAMGSIGKVTLGKRISPANTPMGNGYKGKIYEVLIYFNDINASDRALIETHLKTKYGIS